MYAYIKWLDEMTTKIYDNEKMRLRQQSKKILLKKCNLMLGDYPRALVSTKATYDGAAEDTSHSSPSIESIEALMSGEGISRGSMPLIIG